MSTHWRAAKVAGVSHCVVGVELMALYLLCVGLPPSASLWTAEAPSEVPPVLLAPRVTLSMFSGLPAYIGTVANSREPSASLCHAHSPYSFPGRTRKHGSNLMAPTVAHKCQTPSLSVLGSQVCLGDQNQNMGS